MKQEKKQTEKLKPEPEPKQTRAKNRAEKERERKDRNGGNLEGGGGESPKVCIKTYLASNLHHLLDRR